MTVAPTGIGRSGTGFGLRPARIMQPQPSFGSGKKVFPSGLITGGVFFKKVTFYQGDRCQKPCSRVFIDFPSLSPFRVYLPLEFQDAPLARIEVLPAQIAGGSAGLAVTIPGVTESDFFRLIETGHPEGLPISKMGLYIPALGNLEGYFFVHSGRQGQLDWADRYLLYPELPFQPCFVSFNRRDVTVQDPDDGRVIDRFRDPMRLVLGALAGRYIGDDLFRLPTGLVRENDHEYGQDPLTGEVYALDLRTGIKTILPGPEKDDRLFREDLPDFSGTVFRKASCKQGEISLGQARIPLGRKYLGQTVQVEMRQGLITVIKDQDGQDIALEDLPVKEVLYPDGRFRGYIVRQKLDPKYLECLGDGIISFSVKKGIKDLDIFGREYFLGPKNGHDRVKIHVSRGRISKIEAFDSSVSLERPVKTIQPGR